MRFHRLPTLRWKLLHPFLCKPAACSVATRLVFRSGSRLRYFYGATAIERLGLVNAEQLSLRLTFSDKFGVEHNMGKNRGLAPCG